MAKQSLVRANMSDDDQPGACFITDVQTGEQHCRFLTQSECAQNNGQFVGGLCPPGSMAVMSVKAGMPKAKKAVKKAAPKKKAAKKVAVKAKKAPKKKAAPKKKSAAKKSTPKKKKSR